LIEQVTAEVVLISADTEVTHTEIFREPIPSGFSVKGGGGTDFRPALEAVKKHDVNCCVYLTVLEGVFPDTSPAFPVFWATVKDLTVPFGRKIVIES
jgi:predicted metal-dependent peptidase